LTIGCSGASAPAGYSPLHEGSPAARASSSATYLRALRRALCDMPASQPAEPRPLALAIVNARVWTGDARRPWADAVLVSGATIVAVGGSAELRKRAGVTARVIDARGMLVLSRDPAGTILAGAQADLVVVDRMPSDAASAPSEAEIVLEFDAGRLVVDRDGLAR
jgi:hypothetical protein